MGSMPLPGAIASVLIATIYRPSHPSGSAGQALLAAIAGTYVVGMAVLLPRATRVLRRSRSPSRGTRSAVRPPTPPHAIETEEPADDRQARTVDRR